MLAHSLEPAAAANRKHVSVECGWQATPVSMVTV